MKTVHVLGVVAALLVAATASAQFKNPGFETGTLADWSIRATTNGGTQVQDVQLDPDGQKSYWAHFQVGNKATPNQQNQGIFLYQKMDLGLNPTIGFEWLAYNVGTNVDGGYFSVAVDGAAIGSAVETGSFTGYKNGKLSAVYNGSGVHEYGVIIARDYLYTTGTPQQWVDNFTPEPASLSLLALGLLLRRR